MSQRFDEAAEEDLREEFVAASGDRGLSSVYGIRSNLRRTCLVFRELFPADSILNYTHTTEWARPWNARLATVVASTRISRLWTLYEWWAWLFDRHVIDSNVLEFVACEKLAVDAVPPLTLRCKLQRHAAKYLGGLTRVSARSRESYLVWVKRFELFLNRLLVPPAFDGGKLDLDEEVLAAWFRHICGRYERITVLQATNVLHGFFEALARKGVLAENVLERLRREYPTGKRLGVAYALAADDRAAALRALARKPTFQSGLADHMGGFLSLKRAIGCRYPHATTVLRDFGRFLVTRGEDGPITAPLLARWRASRPELSAATHRIRWSVMHQFCLYVRRYVPETHVPDPLFGRLPLPRLKAHIVTPSQMRQLLNAVAVVAAGSRWRLRPHTCRTLFTLLYATGLRISEARSLQVGDVDLRRRVIKIRQTKFYKSRLVPFSDGLLPILRDYHRRRIHLLGAPAPEAPFFVTQYGGHYKKTHLGSVWKRLMRHTGLGGARGVGPRIHDLRHSFATLRLAAWYRDGEDVAAKLPLLSTYLGHTTIAATQRYLTILPETLLAASERFRSYGGSL
ncbi:MAG: tyrosine-type recombinase/integrase, partial [Myxococcaceae bacterium]|nr:tyrosine-type recombinase/integrase [Myxococcaceae bacterium]